MKKILLLISILGIAGTGFSQTYCSSGATSTADSYTAGVTVTGQNNSFTNNTTACVGYSDFTSISADGLLGGTYTLNVVSGTCGATQWTKATRAWIDWNQDGDFDDPGEDLGFGPYASTFNWTTNFTVPLTAAVGSTRLRVVTDENTGASINSCGTYFYGETEDYTFEVLSPTFTAALPDTITLDCFGDTTATLAPNVFNGTTPYTFLWSTGSTDSALFNMGAGSYSVIVTDNASEMDTAFVEVVQPDSIDLNVSVSVPLVCDYDISQADAVATGGTPFSSSYSVDTNSSLYGPDTSQAGTAVVLTDEQVSSPLPIGFNFEFYGNSFDQFAIGSNGYITFDQTTVSYAGTTMPQTFDPNNIIAGVWEDLDPTSGGDISYYTSGSAPFRVLNVNFDNVSYWEGASYGDASFQIRMFETTNCIEIHTSNANTTAATFTAQQTQGIENADGTEATTYPGRNFEEWDFDTSYVSMCPIDSSGILYEWSTGALGGTVVGLPAGTYTVTASDVLGCEKSRTVTIDPAPSNLVSDVNAVDISCFGEDDGSIDPGISGGVAPVAYTWSNGATSSTVSNLEEGVYSVSAEDNLGCTIEVNNVMIHEPELLVGSIYGVEGVLCEDDSTGTASVTIAGGVPPYTPLWSSGEIGITANGLGSGSNTVQVTDSNGCTLFAQVNIPFEVANPTPDLGNNILSTSGASVQLNTVPTTYPVYLWSTNETSTTIDVTQTGLYWVEVSNASGCVGSDTIYVEIWPTGVEEMNTLTGVSFYPNPARDMINFEINTDIDELNVTITDVKGAVVANATFLNGGNASMDVANLSAGVYTLNMKSDELNATQRLVISK